MPAERSKVPGDGELVSRSLEGDANSFGALVERYWRMAVALAATRIDDQTAAEDVAQEGFVRAYKHLHTLRDPSRFAAWLARIVLQRSADHLRERAHRVAAQRLEGVVVAASANPGMTREQRQFVRDAVRRLPDRFQQVVIMRFLGNLSCAEIARQLGKRAGTVRVWLHRSFKKLRTELAPLAEEVAGR